MCIRDSNTMRRLFAAAIADVLSPAVEPQLSVSQAAKAGGSCGPHIRAAYQHLAGASGDAQSPHPEWREH
eukprot:11688214-Prorocentrum_lima.AAC.1